MRGTEFRIFISFSFLIESQNLKALNISRGKRTEYQFNPKVIPMTAIKQNINSTRVITLRVINVRFDFSSDSEKLIETFEIDLMVSPQSSQSPKVEQNLKPLFVENFVSSWFCLCLSSLMRRFVRRLLFSLPS